MTLVSHEKLDVVFSSTESELARYRLQLEIPGSVSKAKRQRSIQALKKNADFKGFRKGSIPPFIMKDIPSFVLKDSIDDMLGQALKELDLKPLDGEDSEPELDMKALLKDFKAGEDFRFSLEMSLRKLTGEVSEDVGEDIVEVETDADISDMDIDVKQRIEAEFPEAVQAAQAELAKMAEISSASQGDDMRQSS